MDDNFTLQLDNGYVIQRHHVDTSQEALGIQIRPDCSMADEKQYLLDRVKRWCDSIRARKLHGYEAWYVLNSTICKTLEHPLTATSFTRQDINQIMAPIFKIALNLCHLQKNLPRKLLFGPIEVRGNGLHDPFLCPAGAPPPSYPETSSQGYTNQRPPPRHYGRCTILCGF